jgi:hypothetical protein
MRYDTLRQLHDAMKAGEVTGTLMIDNDEVGMYAGNEKIFEMHPNDLFVQALDLLDIPHEYL